MTDRTRTYSWIDPGDERTSRAGRTGLEYVHALISGAVPNTPTSATMDYRMTAAGPGWVEFQMEPHEFLTNRAGGIQGGVIAAVIDSALGTALLTTVDQENFTTLDLSCRYIRAIRPGTGTVTIRAEVQHRGRTTGTVTATVHDGAGKLAASATSTLLILSATPS